jgi:hypothetical protein
MQYACEITGARAVSVSPAIRKLSLKLSKFFPDWTKRQTSPESEGSRSLREWVGRKEGSLGEIHLYISAVEVVWYPPGRTTAPPPIA